MQNYNKIDSIRDKLNFTGKPVKDPRKPEPISKEENTADDDSEEDLDHFEAKKGENNLLSASGVLIMPLRPRPPSFSTLITFTNW